MSISAGLHVLVLACSHRTPPVGPLLSEPCAAEFEGTGDAYSTATCAAREGDVDSAFELLTLALDLGYEDFDTLRTVPDLAPLRADPRWAPLVDTYASRVAMGQAPLHPGLLALVQADQADRARSVDDPAWAEVEVRDADRRRQVAAILAAGGAKVSEDWFNAALVFQHGTTIEDYNRATELAQRAVELDPSNRLARWLVAASIDRALVHEGKPQRYATQYRQSPGGAWELAPVDPAVTDEERSAYGCATLAEAHARANDMD